MKNFLNKSNHATKIKQISEDNQNKNIVSKNRIKMLYGSGE